MRKPGAVLVAIALALLLGGFVLLRLRRPDDASLVRAAIADAAKAAREGRPGGVLDNLTAEASLNGQAAPSPLSISDTIRRLRPDVRLKDAPAVVTGDEARVVTAGDVTLGVLGAKRTFDIPRATVILTKVPETTFFFLPGYRWRVARVEIPDDAAQSLLAQFAGGF